MAIQIPAQSVRVRLPGTVQESTHNPVGRAVTQFAELGKELTARTEAAANDMSRLRTVAQFKSEFLTTYQARRDQGGEGLADDANALAESLKKSALAGVSPGAAQAVTSDIDLFLLQRAPLIAGDERKIQIDGAKRDLGVTIQAYTKQFHAADDRDLQDDAIVQITTAIDAARERGVLFPKNANDLKVATLSDLQEVRVLQAMIDDPELAAKALADPSAFPGLDPKERVQLQLDVLAAADAQRSRDVRLAEKAERNAEKAFKEQQEQTAAQLRIGTLDGSMTEERLVADLQARRITLSQFNNILTGLRQEEQVEDDPELLVEVLDGIYNNEIGADAVMALPLTAETKRTFLDKVDQVERRGGPLATNEAKRHREFVDQNVGGLRGPFAVLDTDSSTRVAAALREYDDRILDGESPREVAEDVVPRYRPTSATLGGLPKPRFMVGESKGTIDLKATWERTQQARNNEDITDEQLMQEAALLKQYLQILEAQNAGASSLQ